MIPSKLKLAYLWLFSSGSLGLFPAKSPPSQIRTQERGVCKRTASILAILLSAIFYLDIPVNLDNIIMLEKEILEKIYKHYTFSVLNI